MKISMDCIVYHNLSNRPIQLRKGDKIDVISYEDLKAKIRLLEGEEKGKVFVVDRIFVTD